MEAYLRDRAAQYGSWYDAKAVKAKRNYLWSRAIIALGAILTPILVFISIPIAVFDVQFDLAIALSALAGILVASLVTLEGVFKHQEQWKNYRTTEQYIITHIFMFGHGVGEYDDIAVQDGFKSFVQNVELAIKSENEVTLNVLTRVSGAEGSGSIAKHEIQK